MNRRALGGVIVAAWLAGIGVLIQREYFRPQLERLAEAALRVTPGAVYFGVMHHGQQVGFASSTIDTTPSSIIVSDYFVADTTTGKERQRIAEWTDATLTRGMRLNKFATELDGNGLPQLAGGRFIGDSVLLYGMGSVNRRVDSQRVAISAQSLLPNMVPLAVALMGRPKAGKKYLLPVLDPKTMRQRTVAMRVEAESLFTIADSAVFDSATARWKAARTDTVRAWRIARDSSGMFDGWVDEQGRVVQTTQLGFVVQRMPYEIAFENWKADSLHSEPARTEAPFRAEILRSPAILGSAATRRVMLPTLELSLAGMDLSAFALSDRRQRLSHDTLFVGMDDVRGVGSKPTGIQVDPEKVAKRLQSYVPPTPTPGYTPSMGVNPVVVDLATRLASGTHDAAELARRLTYWVHDSIAPGRGNSNMLNTLAGRTGNALDHVQLFMAITRPSGIPTRVATGLHYADGGFYYHVWCDVMLDGTWIAVDPTFGEFPADAAHVFLSPRLMSQDAFLRLVAPLRITVLSVGTPVATPPRRPPSK